MKQELELPRHRNTGTPLIEWAGDKLTNGSVETWNNGVKSGVYAKLQDRPGGYLLIVQVAPGV